MLYLCDGVRSIVWQAACVRRHHACVGVCYVCLSFKWSMYMDGPYLGMCAPMYWCLRLSVLFELHSKLVTNIVWAQHDFQPYRHNTNTYVSSFLRTSNSVIIVCILPMWFSLQFIHSSGIFHIDSLIRLFLLQIMLCIYLYRKTFPFHSGLFRNSMLSHTSGHTKHFQCDIWWRLSTSLNHITLFEKSMNVQIRRFILAKFTSGSNIIQIWLLLISAIWTCIINIHLYPFAWESLFFRKILFVFLLL